MLLKELIILFLLLTNNPTKQITQKQLFLVVFLSKFI